MAHSDLFSKRLGRPEGRNRLSAAFEAARASGRSLVNLAESNPTLCGLSPDGVLPALSSDRALVYAPDSRGLLSAREALAARSGGSASDYFLSASTSEAYSWIFKLVCDPGDAVLVPKPGYPLFDYLAGLESARVVPYRLFYAHPRGWGVDIDSLREAAVPGTKAVVLIHPNNPTGSYVSADERAAIVGLCRERGMALIVDEVFFEYAVEETVRPSSFRGEGGCLTFVLDGLSKLLCLPQMKLGWTRLSGPAGLADEAAARLEIIADTYLSAGTPVMGALPELLPRADAFTAGLRERLARNMAALRSAFEGGASPYRVLRCGGGWTALLEYPRVLGEEELAVRLVGEEGVMVHPGFFFDTERDGLLALSLLLEPDRFDEGVRRLRRFFMSVVES